MCLVVESQRSLLVYYNLVGWVGDSFCQSAVEGFKSLWCVECSPNMLLNLGATQSYARLNEYIRVGMPITVPILAPFFNYVPVGLPFGMQAECGGW